MRNGLPTTFLFLCLAAAGCTGEYGTMAMTRGEGPPGGPTRPTDPDAPPPWTLTVDTSGMDPYLPLAATTGPVRGRVMASDGIGRMMIGGTTATATADGMFAADVPVMPGLNLVTIDAFDRATPEHQRKAHRTLIVSDLLLEGDL